MTDDRAVRPKPEVSSSKPERHRPHAGRPFILGTIHPETEEIRELAATLGLDFLLEVYQQRNRAHPGTFFGKGRLAALKDEIGEWKAGIWPGGWVWVDDHWVPGSAPAEPDEPTAWGGTAWTGGQRGDPLVSGEGRDASGSEAAKPPREAQGARRGTMSQSGEPRRVLTGKLLLILNEDVRPATLFNLEERLGIEVWDRTRLILEIFSLHAHVKEAKLQVELAMLQYEIPLIHELVHRRKAGERPGFLSGGEYGVADYEDFIKRRMRAVKDELERIRDEREVRRKVRRERFYLVSLAGYTNAGKSSLLNALTDAGALSAGTLFSTLETTTRRLSRKLPHEPEGAPMASGASDYARPILMTDTVGFIQALPSWLVEAFHSTLEEIGVSDVVLLVLDVSDPMDVLREKLRVCRTELSYLDVTCPVLVILNKVDLMPPAAVYAKKRRLLEEGLIRADLVVEASSVTGAGVDDIIGLIDTLLPTLIHYEARIPSQGSQGPSLLSRMYGFGPVEQVDYGNHIVVRARCDPLHWKELLKAAREAEAAISRLTS